MKALSRFGVCLLGILFIFSSLGAVLAVDPSPDPTPVPTPEIIDDPLLDVVGETAMYYIWLCMRSWGIDIEYNGADDFNDQISSFLADYVFQYLDTLPSAYTINQWVSPWLGSLDVWGNYRFNNSALEDIQDFVDWLVVTLGIADNVTIPVLQSSYTIGEMVVYKAPVQWYAYNNYQSQRDYHNDMMGRISPTVDTDSYLFFVSGDGSQTNARALVLTKVPSTVAVDTYFPVWNETLHYQLQTSLWNNIWGEPILNPSYYICEMPYGSGAPYEVIGYETLIYTYAEAAAALSQPFAHNDVTLEVITGEVILPDDDPDYQTGYSITIIDDRPIYVELDWNGEVIVSNLPAIVSTGEIPVPGDALNPGLVNAWHPISTLIEMTADSMGMLIGIVYEFPEEVLIPIFAVLGGIIIFGIIHAMKEH